MRRHPRLAALAFVALVAVACAREEPLGRDPEPEEPPVAAADRAPAPGPQAARGEEPLALRFVSPNVGPPAGGNEVTIDGSGFADFPRVDFGQAQAWIRSVTPTAIRVTVPPPPEPVAAGETLVVDVTVTNPPGGAGAPVSERLAGSYTYVGPEPPAPEPPAAVAEATGEPPGEAEPAPPPVTGPTLVANFSFETIDVGDGCPPPSASVRFTDRSTGGPTEWRWDFGDGSTSDQQHPGYCYAIAGMRSVTLNVSNSETSASTSKIVTVGVE